MIYLAISINRTFWDILEAKYIWSLNINLSNSETKVSENTIIIALQMSLHNNIYSI